jgi:hypothetical protein
VEFLDRTPLLMPWAVLPLYRLKDVPWCLPSCCLAKIFDENCCSFPFFSSPVVSLFSPLSEDFFLPMKENLSSSVYGFDFEKLGSLLSPVSGDP